MKKTVRRTLSLVLCLALLIATVPIFVFAAGTAELTLDASSYSAGVDTTTVTNVTLPIKATATNVSVADLDLTYDNEVFESATAELGSDIVGSVSLSNGALWWEIGDEDDAQNISGEFIILTLTLKSGAKTGETTVSITGTMTDDEYDDIDVSASAIINITEGSTTEPEIDGFSAGMDVNLNTVTVGNEVIVKVGINNGEATTFNAAQVVVTYDPKVVEYVSAVGNSTEDSDIEVKFDENVGTVTLLDFGPDKTCSDNVYTLTFKAIAATEDNTDTPTTTIVLTSADVSEKNNAVMQDLAEATVIEDSKEESVTVQKVRYTVTFNPSGILSGATEVKSGDSYTFEPEGTTGMYYDYTVSATMGEAEATVTGDAASGWTIENVTGDLVITGSRTEKKFDVTTNTTVGENTTSETATDGATYNTDYTFTVPNDEPAGTNVGYTYTLTSVLIGGQVYTGYSSVEGTKNYKIPGADITGDIVINITKEEVDPNKFTVSITGEGSGQVAADPTIVDRGGSVTLTLTPEEGYIYVVKVKGTEVLLDENSQYVISNVQSADEVNVTVEKTLDTTSAEVVEYLTLDGTNMWLVKIGSAKIDGKVYTYNGTNMFWSSKYAAEGEDGAYVTLIIAETAPTGENLAVNFGLITESAREINYTNMDVNNTGILDANDAQLVWNMYGGKMYTNFETVDIEIFLQADVNDAVGVDITDAKVIVNAILNPTVTN